jgi:hypothetical protein
MQLMGRCGVQAPVRVGTNVAAVEGVELCDAGFHRPQLMRGSLGGKTSFAK